MRRLFDFQGVNSCHALARAGLCAAVLFAGSLPAHAQRLEQLINAALATHPSAQGQRALVQSAEASVDSANWQFYPTPSVSIESANASATDRLYQGDNRVSTVRLQQPLWTGGRLTAGMDKAAAGLAASQASLAEVRLQLGLRVMQAYGDWLSAYLKTLANEKSLATHLRLRDQVNRRLSEGASAQSDLTLAVTRLESISADVTAARAQTEVALARLGQLLGGPVDGARLAQAVAAPREYANAGRTGVPALLEMALSINPSVAKAQAQARVQEAVISERRADLSPELFARIERQYGNYNYPNGAPENRLFVGLNSRFGAGLSTLSNIEAARTQYAAALTEIEAQSRTVSEQVLSDYAQAVSTASRTVSIQMSLKAAADVSTSYDRQFLAGRKSWLDVMNAARELAQTETQLADLQSTLVLVTWRLAAYTRGIDAVSGERK
jgi:adhesin transport system outer membrane protein